MLEIFASKEKNKQYFISQTSPFLVNTKLQFAHCLKCQDPLAHTIMIWLLCKAKSTEIKNIDEKIFHFIVALFKVPRAVI